MLQMMHCIVSMVDKCKRALTALQERSQRDREELAMWMRRHSENIDTDMKKRSLGGDLMGGMRDDKRRVGKLLIRNF